MRVQEVVAEAQAEMAVLLPLNLVRLLMLAVKVAAAVVVMAAAIPALQVVLAAAVPMTAAQVALLLDLILLRVPMAVPVGFIIRLAAVVVLLTRDIRVLSLTKAATVDRVTL